VGLLTGCGILESVVQTPTDPAVTESSPTQRPTVTPSQEPGGTREIAEIEWDDFVNTGCEDLPTYRIDLVAHEVWIGYPLCKAGDPSPSPPSGAPAADGFWLTKALSAAEVQGLRDSARAAQLERWEPHYGCKDVWTLDSPVQSVKITYVDGSTMSSSTTCGNGPGNDYPGVAQFWDAVRKATATK
jgi:hypothetical protein